MLRSLVAANPHSTLAAAWRGGDGPSTSPLTWTGTKWDPVTGSLVELMAGDAAAPVIPPQLGRLTTVTKLWLNNNGARCLPRELAGCSSLLNLWLQQNLLRGLPQGLGAGLRRLQVLSLAGNLLPALDAALCELTTVQWLDVSECKITAVSEDLGNMSSLTRLDLHTNALEQLPDSIGRLGRLRQLSLRECDTLARRGSPTCCLFGPFAFCLTHVVAAAGKLCGFICLRSCTFVHMPAELQAAALLAPPRPQTVVTGLWTHSYATPIQSPVPLLPP